MITYLDASHYQSKGQEILVSKHLDCEWRKHLRRRFDFFTRAMVTLGFCSRPFVEAICLRSVNATTRLVKLCKSLTGIRALCATEREEDR